MTIEFKKKVLSEELLIKNIVFISLKFDDVH